ncbi:hypothetical protein [Massilioclostridium coli]|uniref:hypothetical protein n=1 Tax=Massilioclostridium coli TaxID=1870991 RepID=UPI0022E61A6D|nr:hypothetical protein [Massilioclostridium coli]
MLSSKYIQSENKEQTVLCALASGGGYSEFLQHSEMIDNEALTRMIINYIEQGKYIFVSLCQNKVELVFCQTIMKLKGIYPHIKLVFVANTPCLETKIQNNPAYQMAFNRQNEFDEIIQLKNFWEENNQLYSYLFQCASILVGVYSKYEMTVKQFCKLARAADIEIRNLYKKEKMDINVVLAVTHETFGGLPVSTIRLVNESTKYQQLIMQIQEIITCILETENMTSEKLIRKINQLERKYSELQQHISAYFFLSNFMESTH